MKAIRLLCVFLSILCLFGCYISEQDSILLQIDEMVESNPDSALGLLSGIKSNDLSPSQHARYALLYVQAFTKFKQQEIESDSLINIALNYYKERGDSPELAKCQLYLGGYYVQLGLTEEAIQAFIHAEQIALKKDEVYLLGLIYDRRGDLCVAQGLYKEALEFYDKARSCFVRTHSKKNESIQLFGKGRTLLFFNQPDSALYYLNQAKLGAQELNDMSLYSLILNVEGFIFLSQGDFVRGKMLIQQSIEEMEPHVPSSYYSALSNVYLLENKHDLARIYVQKAMDGTEEKPAYAGLLYQLYEIEMRAGNYEDAAKYMKQVFLLRDSVSKVNRKKSVLVFANKYNYELEKGKVTVLRFVVMGILFFVILLVVIGGAFIWRKQYLLNRWKQDLSEHKFRLDNLNLQLAYRESHDEELKVLIQRQLELMKDVMLKSPCKTVEYYKDILLNQPTEEGWKELELFINLLYFDLVDYLKSTYPQLKEEEIRLCYLVAVGFRTKEICIFLGRTESTIDNWRYAITSSLFPIRGIRFTDFIKEALQRAQENKESILRNN